MKKRGQITIFMILALSVMIILGLLYYIIGYNTKAKSTQIIMEASDSKDIGIVKSYAESCLKSVSEDALFKRAGIHGGYIEPNGSLLYNEDPLPDGQKTYFLNNSVPYYLEADCKSSCAFNENIPKESAIIEKLQNYIIVEFQKCLNTTVFEDIGLSIAKPAQNINVDVSLNKEDVSIKLNYPLTITSGKARIALDFFAVTLPIRLKALYSSSIELVQKIEAANSGEYIITPADCISFDKNGLTNVYVKSSDNGPKEIIQFVDFSTYEKYYFHSYIFQFAVKNIRVDGNCVG